jgi:hypothetical protein
VRNEYISLDSAEDNYGVVIHHSAPRKWVLDLHATEALRQDLRAKRAALDGQVHTT